MNTGDKVTPSTVAEFVQAPTLARLYGLGKEKSKSILEYLKQTANDATERAFDGHVQIAMKLCSTVNSKSDHDAVGMVEECVDQVLADAFAKAASSDGTAELNNSLLVHMGLIKVRYNTIFSDNENRLNQLEYWVISFPE